MIRLFIDLLGWLGAGGLLLAYGLVSSGRLAGKGATFQSINLIGAGLLAINTAYYGAWPSTALNVVWIGIGAVTVMRLVAAARMQRTSADG